MKRETNKIIKDLGAAHRGAAREYQTGTGDIAIPRCSKVSASAPVRRFPVREQPLTRPVACPPPSSSQIKSSKTIGERVSRRRTRRRVAPTVRTSRPHRLRRNRRALRRDTFMTVFRTNILTQRPAQTCPSPRQRPDSSPFAYGPLGVRQSLASATIKTSESVAQRQCATDRRETET